MKQLTTPVAIGAAILIGAAVAALVWLSPLGQPAEQHAKQTSPSGQTTGQARTEINYLAKPGITSLEQLKQEASDVVTKQSEYGEYVDSIEGHKGGEKGKYWSFYVDGSMSDVGADSYTQKGGEEITWKYQKL